MTEAQYLAVKQIIESTEYPFTRGQVREWLLRRHRNGLDRAVRKIGRRIYLNKLEFDRWIEERAERKS